MSTVAERFETVVARARDVMRLSEDLVTLGLHGRDEQAALTVLMITLDKAMKVLDPEGAKKFVAESLAEKMKMPELNIEDLKAALEGAFGNQANAGTGNYL
ncbi:hypothetical protein SEA_FAUST_90 [Streptomyces phage Faust]|uniref:Uncharacterized protein n=1 Tax=Streptomyces phage Faust TaxID=2767565 RepID=A0A7G9UYT8_9CAUD|nr:hypothetical protein PP456_gp166 [Streptomyces phage Faust]QNN99193.1 hypothetical protein SEA_FAUST_90 [Streptomyces phage Faust]